MSRPSLRFPASANSDVGFPTHAMGGSGKGRKGRKVGTKAPNWRKCRRVNTVTKRMKGKGEITRPHALTLCERPCKPRVRFKVRKASCVEVGLGTLMCFIDVNFSRETNFNFHSRREFMKEGAYLSTFIPEKRAGNPHN